MLPLERRVTNHPASAIAEDHDGICTVHATESYVFLRAGESAERPLSSG